jgi:hypothetical protein
MNRPIPWFLIVVVALLLVAPTPLGRVLLDILGGLTLTVLLLPVLIAGAGFVALLVLRNRMRTCEVCGVSSLATDTCPACGAHFGSAEPTGRPFLRSLFGVAAVDEADDSLAGGTESKQPNMDVRDVTIDVKARSVTDD